MIHIDPFNVLIAIIGFAFVLLFVWLCELDLIRTTEDDDAE